MNSKPLSTGPIRGVKSNAKTRVVKCRLIRLQKGLSSDQTIEFTGVQVAFGLNLNAGFVYIRTESVI